MRSRCFFFSTTALMQCENRRTSLHLIWPVIQCLLWPITVDSILMQWKSEKLQDKNLCPLLPNVLSAPSCARCAIFMFCELLCAAYWCRTPTTATETSSHKYSVFLFAFSARSSLCAFSHWNLIKINCGNQLIKVKLKQPSRYRWNVSFFSIRIRFDTCTCCTSFSNVPSVSSAYKKWCNCN